MLISQEADSNGQNLLMSGIREEIAANTALEDKIELDTYTIDGRFTNLFSLFIAAYPPLPVYIFFVDYISINRKVFTDARIILPRWKGCPMGLPAMNPKGWNGILKPCRCAIWSLPTLPTDDHVIKGFADHAYLIPGVYFQKSYLQISSCNLVCH